MSKKIADFVIKYRISILIFILIVTGFFGFQLKNLEVYTAFEDLYPHNHPFIPTYKEILKKFAGGNLVTLMVAVKEGNIFNLKTLAKIQRITFKAEELNGVNLDQISSIAHRAVRKAEIRGGAEIRVNPIMYPYLPSNQEEINQVRAACFSTPGVTKFLVSNDGKSTLITIGFIEERMDYRILFDQLQKIKKEESDDNTRIYLTGYPMLMGWVFYYITQGYWIFFGTLFVIICLFALSLKSIRAMAIPLFAGVISGIWGLGFASTMGYNLDPLIYVVLFLIMARILSHSIQMQIRFKIFYSKNNDPKLAAADTLEELLMPGFIGIATDALGVFFISVTVIPLMRKLAIYGSIWLLSIIISVLVLTPIILSFAPGRPMNVTDKKVDFFARFVPKFTSLITGKISPYIIIGLFLLTGFVGFYFMKDLVIGDTHPGSPLLWPDSAYNVSTRRINEKFPGSDTLHLLVKGVKPHTIKNPEVAYYVENFGRNILNNDPNVGGTLSYVILIKSLKKMYHYGDPKWEKIPYSREAIADMLYFYIVGAGVPGALDRWIDVEYKDAVMTVFYKDHQGATIKSALSKIRGFLASNPPPEGFEVKFGGGLIGNFAAINDEVARSQELNVYLVFPAILIMIIISFRSFMAGAILIAPLFLSVVVTIAVMVPMKIGLSIDTLPVISVGTGVGIDYGIYMLSAIQAQYLNCRDYPKSISIAFNTAGKAIFITAVTLVLAIILWFFFSSLKFQGDMSILISIIMGYNAIGALLFVPAMVYILKPKFVSKIA